MPETRLQTQIAALALLPTLCRLPAKQHLAPPFYLALARPPPPLVPPRIAMLRNFFCNRVYWQTPRSCAICEHMRVQRNEGVSSEESQCAHTHTHAHVGTDARRLRVHTHAHTHTHTHITYTHTHTHTLAHTHTHNHTLQAPTRESAAQNQALTCKKTTIAWNFPRRSTPQPQFVYVLLHALEPLLRAVNTEHHLSHHHRCPLTPHQLFPLPPFHPCHTSCPPRWSWAATTAQLRRCVADLCLSARPRIPPAPNVRRAVYIKHGKRKLPCPGKVILTILTVLTIVRTVRMYWMHQIEQESSKDPHELHVFLLLQIDTISQQMCART